MSEEIRVNLIYLGNFWMSNFFQFKNVLSNGKVNYNLGRSLWFKIE